MNEDERIKKFEEVTQRMGANLLYLGYKDTNFEGQYMEKTKPLAAMVIVNGQVVYSERTTTWARLLREVNEVVKPYRHKCKKIDGVDEIPNFAWFDMCLMDFVEDYNLGMNGNFSNQLFKDDSYINSKVYLNNQNHKLEIFDEENIDRKYICAVYPTEVVCVLYALMCISQDAHIYIRYVDKNERNKFEVRELSSENRKFIESTLNKDRRSNNLKTLMDLAFVLEKFEMNELHRKKIEDKMSTLYEDFQPQTKKEKIRKTFSELKKYVEEIEIRIQDLEELIGGDDNEE